MVARKISQSFFKKNPYKGLFVVVEGLDGSGVSTQVERVAYLLRNKIEIAHRKAKVITTKEPTDNVIGGLIRGAITGIYQLNSQALQLLFTADRGHHLQRLIIPSLEAGNIVIGDRYFWSTIAFGGISNSRQWLMELNRNFIMPDLSIILRVDPSVCMKRIVADRFDIELFEQKQKLVSVWRNYEWLKQSFPKHIVVCDGERPVPDIAYDIENIICKMSKFKKLFNK